MILSPLPNGSTFPASRSIILETALQIDGMQSQESCRQYGDPWILNLPASQQETTNTYVEAQRYIPCTPSPSKGHFPLPSATFFEKRNQDSRSSSNSTGSDGTVEVHDERRTGWELHDTESDLDASDLDSLTQARQRLVRTTWCRGPPSRLIQEGGITAAEFQPSPSLNEEDATSPIHGPLQVGTVMGDGDEIDTVVQCLLPRTVVDDNGPIQICESRRQFPNLKITAPPQHPNISLQHSRRSSPAIKPLAGSREVSRRQISSTSAFSSGSPRDSPKLWLRRDISSGRYFITRAPTPAAQTVSRLASFDMTSEICAVSTFSEGGGVMVRYNTRLSFTWAGSVESSTTVAFEIVVRNARQADRTIHLEPGDNSVLLNSEHKRPFEESDKPTTITIVRHAADLGEPLNVYLATLYPLIEGQTSICLPSFRPISGSVLFELFFFKEPCLPLSVKPLMRDVCSTWNIKTEDGHGLVFDRIATLPRLFPEAFLDDVSVRFQLLQAVRFSGLERLNPASATLWNVTMTVGKILSQNIHCDVRLELAVGQSQTLLAVDARGWTPVFCLVNGRPPRKESNHWVKDESEKYILPKQPYMEEGQGMNIEVHWEMPFDSTHSTSAIFSEISLPCVIDNMVLGGRLTCTLPAGIIGTICLFDPPG